MVTVVPVVGKTGIVKNARPEGLPGKPVQHTPGRFNKECRYRINNQGIQSMPQDPRKTISRLSDHVVLTGTVDYLLSDQFTRFCREQDIEDSWTEALGYSRDKPDLYGDAVVKNAFLMLLRHLYLNRTDEFPNLVAGLLADCYREYPGPAFVEDILQDLTLLGYSRSDIETLFSKTWK